MELCKKYPVFCTIWAFMEVVLFAGVIFGWGSLVFILKDEGFYLQHCLDNKIEIEAGFIVTEHVDVISNGDHINTIGSNSTGDDSAYPTISVIPNSNSYATDDVYTHDSSNPIGYNVSMVDIHVEPHDAKKPNSTQETKVDLVIGCQAQESKLNLWFSIAVSFMYLSFGGIGYIIQKFGTRVTRITFFIIYLIGTFCLAFASPDVPWLLLPGLCCIGTGGLVMLATNMQVSYLHPRLRSTIVAIFTGLFDFSSINKQLIRIMYEHGIARRFSYIIISSLFAVIILISTLFFLPKMNISEEFVKNAEKRKKQKQEEKGDEEEKEKMNVVVSNSDIIVVNTGATAIVASDLSSKGEELVKLGVSNSMSVNAGENSNKPSLLSTILSVTFILHLCWLFVNALRFVTFIGQLNVWLSNIFNRNEVKVGQMLGIFSYMTMGAIGTALFCGFVYDYLRKCYMDASEIRRIYLPVVLPMILVVFYSVGTTVCCYIQNEVAVYMAFIFFTFFRSSLFTVAVAFIGDAFPAEYFGVLFGMLQVSAGIAGLVQYPLFTWYDAYEGSYMHVNIFLLVLQVVTLLHPLLLFIKGRRDKHDKNNPFRQEYTINVPSTA